MIASAPGSTLESLKLSEGYAGLGERFVERRDPTPLGDPHLVAFNPDAAALLDLDGSQGERPEFLRLAAGCARFAGVEPFAAVYAGHQFGTFVPQLGDGRAITLAEVAGRLGPFEWQVKGAGQTAFSRFGDGRAVLRSTIREYLCSEAMAALDIPTTRALAIAASDDPVFREKPETAAVLTRIAPSHLRFGTFEYFHARGDADAVRILADYAIAKWYGDLADLGSAERYGALLRAIVTRTAALVARWQAVGFAHGVMNTDNMSALGLTLDYGPYGFLDRYDPTFICNHTDAGGRYAFDQQPTVAQWNCHALAAALSTLVPQEAAQEALAAYVPAFQTTYATAIYAKFGLSERQPEDVDFLSEELATLQRGGADYTNAFRALSRVAHEPSPNDEAVVAAFESGADGRMFVDRYRARLARESRPNAERTAAMLAVNPKYILRNYLAETAIRAAQSRDYSELARLHAVLRRPFEDQPEHDAYAAPPPDWATSLSVSCSS